MTTAGLEVTRSTTLTVRVQVATFEEWWRSFGYGIGPAGEYFATLTAEQHEALRARCTDLLPDEPFEIAGMARAATAQRA